MSDTEYVKRPNIFKVLTQWVFLPVIGFLVGIVGTYATQVQSIRDAQVISTRDSAALYAALKQEREERESTNHELTGMLKTIVSLDTEVISLFKVQQQTK